MTATYVFVLMVVFQERSGRTQGERKQKKVFLFDIGSFTLTNVYSAKIKMKIIRISYFKLRNLILILGTRPEQAL